MLKGALNPRISCHSKAPPKQWIRGNMETQYRLHFSQTLECQRKRSYPVQPNLEYVHLSLFKRGQRVTLQLFQGYSFMWQGILQPLLKAKIKDGAYFCYCLYVLCISRFSDFLWVVPTNTAIFLRGLKLFEESRT